MCLRLINRVKIFEHNMLSVAFSLDIILVLKLVCLFLSKLETAIFLYNNFEVEYQYKGQKILLLIKSSILRKHVINMIYTQANIHYKCLLLEFVINNILSFVVSINRQSYYRQELTMIQMIHFLWLCWCVCNQ